MHAYKHSYHPNSFQAIYLYPKHQIKALPYFFAKNKGKRFVATIGASSFGADRMRSQTCAIPPLEKKNLKN